MTLAAVCDDDGGDDPLFDSCDDADADEEDDDDDKDDDDNDDQDHPVTAGRREGDLNALVDRTVGHEPLGRPRESPRR